MINGIIQFDLVRLLSLDSAFQVSQQTVSIVERFGKFVKIADAGINFKIPFVDQLVTTQSLRIHHASLQSPTFQKKTSKNNTHNTRQLSLISFLFFSSNPDRTSIHR